MSGHQCISYNEIGINRVITRLLPPDRSRESDLSKNIFVKYDDRSFGLEVLGHKTTFNSIKLGYRLMNVDLIKLTYLQIFAILPILLRDIMK